MLGISMEEGVESGLGVPSKKQPTNPKVQQITSFFKSPTNSEAKKANTEKKTQDLLGYFKPSEKTKRKKNDGEDSTQKKDNSTLTKNSKSTGDVPCKPLKRKIDDLNSSLEDFETKPSTCSERQPSKKKITKVKDSKHSKGEKVTGCEKDDDVKKQEISYEDFLKESSESKFKDISQDSESQEVKKNLTDVSNCKLNGEIISSKDSIKSKEPEEISYLDFLNQTGCTAKETKACDDQRPVDKAKDDIPVLKPGDMKIVSSPIKNVKLRPPKKNETPTKLKPDEEEDEDEKLFSKPAPKCHSITSFFTKTTSSAANKALFKKKEDYNTLTIKAVVHPEPSPPKNGSNPSASPAHSTSSSIDEVKSNVSVKEADVDMSITFLESIEIPDKKCKKDVRKRLVSSDEEDSSEGVTTLTGDALESDNVIGMEGIEKLPEEVTEKEKDIVPLTDSVDEKIQNSASGDKNALLQTSKMEDEKSVSLSSQKVEENHDKLKEERKQITAVKMASLDSIQHDMSKKSTQATLSFGGGKMGVVKAQIPKPEISLVDEKANDENQNKTKETEKANKNVPKTNNEPCVNTASSDIENSTPESKQKRPKRKGSKTKNKIAKDQLDTSGTDFEVLSPMPSESKDTKKRAKRGNSAQNVMESPRKRALKNVYKTSMKKKTPLKIRFTKIKSLTELNDDMTPKSKKRVARLSKTQELLMKAKIPATKSKKNLAVKKVASSKLENQAKTIDSQTPTRRSSRQSAMVASIAISDCYEVDKLPRNKSSDKENVQEQPVKALTKTTTPTVKKDSLTPKKQKNKSPKKMVKKAGKIAPIFQSKKGPVASRQDDDVQIIEMDPEVLKVKRAFLMSGIPENLKKQTESAATNLDTVCSVFPKVSHIQQIPTQTEISQKESQFWNLLHVALKLREWSDSIKEKPIKIQRLGELTQCKDTVHKNAVDTVFKKPVEISEEVMKYLLAEVNLTNPAFPVKRMYKQLKRLKCKYSGVPNLDLQEVNTGKANSKTNKRKCPDEDSDNATKRRSKRRKESRKSEIVILDDSPKKETSPPENEGKNEKDMLWTEKYQPQSSSEIIGNQTAVKKMKSWLQDWKQKTDLENKKVKKQLMKAAKQSDDCKEEIRKKLGDDWLTDDESDFDLGSSDEDEEFTEDFSLCNTMLVTGPHGIGKTSLVYALAEELGYKVFEVNASSRRNGKQILAQLQEATQSHQVSKKNLDSMFTSFSMIKEQSTPKKEAPKAEKKMATAFTNFFKKGAKNETDTKEQDKKKGRKSLDKGGKKGKTEDKQKTVAQKLFGGDPSDTKKGLNLSSLSLILFEEVDIVFEEDKGFWNAIQTFIGTTKRPILLTTNDPTFASKFDAKMEHNTLKIPSYMNTASYLQVVSLCENMRTDFHDLVSLVSYNKGDIRKSLLTLQYWAESSGGFTKYPKPIKYSKTFFAKKGVGIGGGDQITNSPMLELSCSQDSNTLSQSRYESADEFETPVKVKRNRSKRFRIEDDNSMESGSQSPVPKGSCGSVITALTGEDSQAAQDVMLFRSQSSQGSSVISVEDVEVADVVGPNVHCGCLQSTNGMTAFMSTKSDDVLSMFQTSKATDICDLDSFCKLLGFSIVYNNLYQLLPLSKIVSPLPLSLGIRPPIQHDFEMFPLPPKPSRILNRNELFDSEGSDSESSNVNGDEDKKEQSIQNKDLPNPVETQTSVKDKKMAEKKPGDNIVHSSIQAFSRFYDNLSYTDSFLTADQIFKEGSCSSRNNEFRWSSAKLTPGQTDQKTNFDETNWWKHNYANDIGAYVETLSLRTLQRKCNDHLVNIKAIQTQDNSCLEQLQIPVENTQTGMRFSQERTTQLSSGANYKKTAGCVAANLPLHVQGQKAAIAMDYLPMFRDVCKTEQIRQAAKTKRRFLHYFDQISMKGMKQSVLDTLCSSFS